MTNADNPDVQHAMEEARKVTYRREFFSRGKSQGLGAPEKLPTEMLQAVAALYLRGQARGISDCELFEDARGFKQRKAELEALAEQLEKG